ATDRRSNEMLESTLNVIDVLKEEDKVGVLYNFIPSTQFTWSSAYRATIEKYTINIPVDRNKLRFTFLLKIGISLLGQLSDKISESLGDGKSKKKNSTSFQE